MHHDERAKYNQRKEDKLTGKKYFRAVPEKRTYDESKRLISKEKDRVKAMYEYRTTKGISTKPASEVGDGLGNRSIEDRAEPVVSGAVKRRLAKAMKK